MVFQEEALSVMEYLGIGTPRGTITEVVGVDEKGSS